MLALDQTFDVPRYLPTSSRRFSHPKGLKPDGSLDTPRPLSRSMTNSTTESIRSAHEVHPRQPGEADPPRGPCWDLWASCGPKVAGRKSLSPRFLLAHHTTRCRGGHPQACGMPILRSANSFAGTGASNQPHHLAVCGLGPRHGRTPQKKAQAVSLTYS